MPPTLTTWFSAVWERGERWVLRARPDLFVFRFVATLLIGGGFTALAVVLLRPGNEDLRSLLGLAAVLCTLFFLMTLALTRGAGESSTVDVGSRRQKGGPRELRIVPELLVDGHVNNPNYRRFWSLQLDGEQVCMSPAEASLYRSAVHLAHALDLKLIDDCGAAVVPGLRASSTADRPRGAKWSPGAIPKGLRGDESNITVPMRGKVWGWLGKALLMVVVELVFSLIISKHWGEVFSTLVTMTAPIVLVLAFLSWRSTSQVTFTFGERGVEVRRCLLAGGRVLLRADDLLALRLSRPGPTVLGESKAGTEVTAPTSSTLLLLSKRSTVTVEALDPEHGAWLFAALARQLEKESG